MSLLSGKPKSQVVAMLGGVCAVVLVVRRT
jgi:hypothetical protein